MSTFWYHLIYELENEIKVGLNVAGNHIFLDFKWRQNKKKIISALQGCPILNRKLIFQITCDLLFKMIILFNASIETLSKMQPV